MYLLDVDFVLRYVPPMDDNGPGIRLNRTFELPFPPSSNVSVFSKEWEGVEEPIGYRLKEVTWDLDRKRFLAETELSTSGVPIAMIPYEISNLLDYGWAYGGYAERYKSERRRGRKRDKLPPMHIGDWDYDEAETWETATGTSRPTEFKTILHAIVSTMAELHNNCSVAYAMLKTGVYVDVPESAIRRELSPIQAKFAAATDEYNSMTSDRQWDWCENVQRRYPRLIDVIEAIK